MSIDAVALLRIPDYEPADDLDVRELDDGFLLYLSLPYDSDDDDLLVALDEALGEALDDHDDDHVFVLPDTLDPDDAETYDAVIAAVGEGGRFLPLASGPLVAGVDPHSHAEASAVNQGMQGMLVEAMQAMGLGSAEDVQKILSGDPDAMLLAQIRMQSAMEEHLTLATAEPAKEPGPEGHDKA